MLNATYSLLLIPALAVVALLGSPPLAATGHTRAGEAADCVEAPAPRKAEIETCSEPPASPELRAKLFHHLRYHGAFPTTGPALLASFRATAELTAAELAWVADRLPPGELPSAAATLSRLLPGAPATVAARLARP
jgi:hypothetical protein